LSSASLAGFHEGWRDADAIVDIDSYP